MKKIIIILSIAFFLLESVQAQVTSLQWQEDLRFLQETVNNEYSFLFKKTTQKIFDEEVEQLHNEIPNLEEHEIIVGMARIVALFQYGHTGFSLRHNGYAFRQLPINLYQYDDGVYIQGVHKDYHEVLGARVVAITLSLINRSKKAERSILQGLWIKPFGIA